MTTTYPLPKLDACGHPGCTRCAFIIRAMLRIHGWRYFFRQAGTGDSEGAE